MPLSRKEYQALSRRLAQIQENQRKLKEIEELTDWLQSNHNQQYAPTGQLMAGLAKLIRLCNETGIVMDDWFVAEFHKLDKTAKLPDMLWRAFARQIRMVQKRKPDIEAPVRYCANCHKREAHFGEYCKRCADELGVRPHGKVGLE